MQTKPQTATHIGKASRMNSNMLQHSASLYCLQRPDKTWLLTYISVGPGLQLKCPGLGKASCRKSCPSLSSDRWDAWRCQTEELLLMRPVHEIASRGLPVVAQLLNRCTVLCSQHPYRTIIQPLKATFKTRAHSPEPFQEGEDPY